MGVYKAVHGGVCPERKWVCPERKWVCPYRNPDEQVQAAVDALWLRQRSVSFWRALPLTSVKSIVRERITPRARTGWTGLLHTLHQ